MFSGGFGSGFGATGKLTSFAAPTVNAKVGMSNGPVKSIGSPAEDVDDGENSEGDGDALAQEDANDEDEIDERFQQKTRTFLTLLLPDKH